MPRFIKKMGFVSILSLCALGVPNYFVHADDDEVIMKKAEKQFIETYKGLLLGVATPESNLIRSGICHKEDIPQLLTLMAHEIDTINQALSEQTFPEGVVNIELLPKTIRGKYLARLAIEQKAGAKLLTAYNNEMGKPVFKFDRPLTAQQKFAVLDLLLRNSASLIEPTRQSDYGFFASIAAPLQQSLISEFLGEFIELPAVTPEDVQYLRQAVQQNPRVVQTSIRAPMPAFRAAQVKISIGLYKAVMGAYPDLTLVEGFSEAKRTAIVAQWDANPDLPLVFTVLTEDIAFAERLSEITGRNFSIMSPAQNELMRRGRLNDTADASGGAITLTKYHFGDDDDEVSNHAFVSTNPLTLGRAHGVREIPAGAHPDAYKNARGFFHPIGNVYERSTDGMVRGGVFHREGWQASSSFKIEDCADARCDDIGSRLAEAL